MLTLMTKRYKQDQEQHQDEQYQEDEHWEEEEEEESQLVEDKDGGNGGKEENEEEKQLFVSHAPFFKICKTIVMIWFASNFKNIILGKENS